MVCIADSDAEIQMSAVAWHGFARGPRTPDQLAVARSFLGAEGVVSFSEGIALDFAGITGLSVEAPGRRTR